MSFLVGGDSRGENGDEEGKERGPEADWILGHVFQAEKSDGA